MALVRAYECVLSPAAEEIKQAGYKASASYNRENQKKEILKLWDDNEFWVSTHGGASKPT